MRSRAARFTAAALLAALGSWGPARLGLLFLFPGVLRWKGGAAPGPIYALPLVSLLFWGALLPVLGLLGLGPGLGPALVLALVGVLLAGGLLEFREFPREKVSLLGAGLALLFLGLRLAPVFQAAGPPGAEPAFHAFLARRILECGGWPADLSPQAPGVPAGGFAPALSFLAASWARASGGGIQALPGLFLLLGCLAQWACDLAFLALGSALAGPAAGGTAALLVGFCSAFPQDVAGWGGAGNLLALAAGCLLLSEWVRGRWEGWRALFFGAAAGAAHPLAGGILFLALLPGALLVRRKKAPALLLCLGLGVFLFSGVPVLLVRGPGFSPAEAARAAAWGRRTGPPAPAALPGALLAPALRARERTGTGVAGLALLGLFLAIQGGGFRKRENKLLFSTLLVPWLVLSGIPARLFPPAGLVYPERAFLFFCPALVWGLSVAAEAAGKRLGGTLPRRVLHGAAALALAFWAAGALRRNYVGVYLERTLQEGLLAPSDLQVLSWMDGHLPHGAVVRTRYDDAGLWVPALAGRRATCFHTVPPLFEEMGRAARKERPRFAFRGARPSPRLGPEWTTCAGGAGPSRKKRKVLRRAGRTFLWGLGR